MALYKATITKTQNLGNGVLIEKGMSVHFPLIGIPWNGGTGTKAINDAFLRVYGIDLKARHVLSPGFVSIEDVK